MRILQRNLKRTKDTFLLIVHTTNVLLFKFRCNILISVINIIEMPGSVASGTTCTEMHGQQNIVTNKYVIVTRSFNLLISTPTCFGLSSLPSSRSSVFFFVLCWLCFDLLKICLKENLRYGHKFQYWNIYQPARQRNDGGEKQMYLRALI